MANSVHDFEWLYEVSIYYVWSVFGLGGLKFLKMVSSPCRSILLGRRLKSEKVRWHGIALSFFLAVWILSGAWNLRAMYCTTIGLFLVSWWLHDHCVGRRQLTWWLPVVMLLWSNLHPGVITGQGLLLGAIGWEWLNRWLKFNTPLDWGRLKRLTIIAGLGIPGDLCQSGPDRPAAVSFQAGAGPSDPEILRRNEAAALLHRACAAGRAHRVLLLAACVLATVLLKLRQFRGWELALLAGLTVLANVAVRCSAGLDLIMLALAVPKMRDLLAEMARTDRRRLTACLAAEDRPILPADAGLQNVPVSAALADRRGRAVSGHHADSAAGQQPADAAGGVLAGRNRAVREEQGLHGRFFSSPDHGAYIGWRLKENGLVYTDTRGFFFPPKLLEDSIMIPEKGADWQARLDRVLNEYHTDYFLLDVAGERGALWRDLQPFIDRPLSLDEKSVLLSADQVRHGLKKLSQQQVAQR